MGDRRRRRRRVVCAAALALTGAGLTGCSSGASSSESIPAVSTITAVTGSDASSTPATAPRPAETVVDVAPSTVPSVDGAALLQGAVATMAPGYHFTTTLSVDGATVLTADGDRVGEGTRLGVVKDGVAVQYVITPAGTWVKPEDGEWQQLETTAPTDPVAALAAPDSVAVTAVEGTATTLAVVVPPASLGLSGEAPVTLSVRVDSGRIVSVGYATTIDGHPAVMAAAIGPVADGSPVVAPI